MSIRVSKLTKTYGQQKALDNISFSINKREIVGFLGPNGAGKSTTMKILTGFLTASSGEASISDHDVKIHQVESKKTFGYLPENNPLYYDMYIREYLYFIADIHQLKPRKISQMENVISITGLLTESHKKISELSKGYKQRVGLAAALIHDPEVLILDEPTSGLDPNQIIEIRDLIKKLGVDKTVLFSSHILQEVEAICDRVIIINKGKIVADDRLQNLRAGKNGHVVIVEFKELETSDLLNKMQFVERIEKIHGSTYKIHTDDPERIRKQLMELSLEHNLNIVSLHSEVDSLETIFRNLTN